MDTEPQLTIALLQELQSYGFTDNEFALIHHHHGSTKIKGHLNYCSNHLRFERNSNNAKVYNRLEIILNAFKGGGFSKDNEKVMEYLAKASVVQIPF